MARNGCPPAWMRSSIGCAHPSARFVAAQSTGVTSSRMQHKRAMRSLDKAQRMEPDDRTEQLLNEILETQRAHLEEYKRVTAESLRLQRQAVEAQARTKSRVTVMTKSGLERYILVRNLSTIAIVMSGRRAVSAGPQLFILFS